MQALLLTMMSQESDLNLNKDEEAFKCLGVIE